MRSAHKQQRPLPLAATPPDQVLLGIAKASNELIINRDLNQAMAEAVRHLGQAMAVDACFIYRNEHQEELGGQVAQVVHHWIREGVPITARQAQVMPHKEFPQMFEALSQRQCFLGKRAQATGKTLALFEVLGIESCLAAPIFIDDAFWGFLGFDDCRAGRSWSETEMALLVSMGASVGAAVDRERYREALEEKVELHNEALQQSKHNLTLIYNHTFESIGLLKVEPNDRYTILSVNDRFINGLAKIGYEFSREFIVGMEVKEFWKISPLPTPREVMDQSDCLRAAVATKERQRMQSVLDAGDSVVHLEEIFTPILDASGEVSHLLVALRNITEQVESAKALQDSERRYRNVVEDQTEFIVRWHENGEISFANHSYCNYFGLDRETLIGTGFIDLIPKDQRDRVKAKFAALTPENPVAVDEHMVRLTNGEVRWNQWVDRALYDAEGNLVEYQSVGQDIHERKMAELALKESEQRMRLAVQNVPVMLNALDEEGNFLVWNAACEEVTGYKAEEIIGNPNALHLLYPDAAYRKHLLANWSFRSVDQQGETEITCKDGSKKTIDWTHHSQSHPIPGWADWGIGIDITERRRARQAEKRLLQDVQVRVKELECLYRIARLCTDPELSVGAVLQQAVEMIPNAWQFPAVAEACINYRGRNHATPKYATTEHLLQAGLVINGRKAGNVRVVYREPHAFLEEERRLIQTIARQVAVFLTERDTEENLRESNRKFYTLLNNLPGVFYRCRNDRAWSMEFLSEECLELTGYPPKLFYERPDEFSWSSIIHPQDQQQVWEGVQEGLRSNKPYRLSYRIQDRFGVEKWVWEQGVGVYNPVGDLVALEGFIHDITDLKLSEERVISAILETEDRERRRIAKELHDSLQQSLTASSLNLSALRKEREKWDARNMRKFDLGMEFLQDAIQESRDIAHNLMPRAIEDFGYVLAVEGMLDGLREASDTNFVFYHNLGDQRLTPSQELSLYRITQEGLSNILKHAGATKVTLQLMRFPDRAVLTLEDDGKGFDPTASHLDSGQFGLSSMHTRARAIAAELLLDSQPGQGTTITVTVPLSLPIPQSPNSHQIPLEDDKGAVG